METLEWKGNNSFFCLILYFLLKNVVNIPFGQNLQVTEYVYPKDSTPEYSSILVPNVDNTRTDFLINTIAKQGKVWEMW